MPNDLKRRRLATNPKGATLAGAPYTFTSISKASIATSAQSRLQEKDLGCSYTTSTPSRKKRKAEEDEETSLVGSLHTLSSTDVPTQQQQISLTPSSSGTPNISAYELPAELFDLINLHSAFLTALSINYAHNGTSSPTDLRIICPNIARVWGKRSVLVEDIRRILGIMNSVKDSRLSLTKYGLDRISIDLAPSTKPTLQPLSERLLNERFIHEVKRRWHCRPNISMQMHDFIAALPLEPVKDSDCRIKISPLLVKGQRRLEHMKKEIAVKRLAAAKEPVIKPDGTRMTLLERLRAKQMHQAASLTTSSKEEVERRTALAKIEEVAAVLGVMSTSGSVGQQRVSFTIPSVLEKIRDSCKTPLSKSEAQTCVTLLAMEIAPAWIKIKKMGKNEMIVVDRDQRLSESEVRGRVGEAHLR